MNLGTPSNDDERAGIHGFYRTPGGRSYLRYAYTRLMRGNRSGWGDSKVAEIVAINRTDREVELTRVSLYRWAEEQQSELWVRDKTKTLTVLRNLEVLLMKFPDIKIILDARSQTKNKTSVMQGLRNFTLDNIDNFTCSKTTALSSKLDGVYLYVISANIIREEDVLEPTSGRYAIWRFDDSVDCRRIHEFWLTQSRSDSRYDVYRDRRVGLAFPDWRKQYYPLYG